MFYHKNIVKGDKVAVKQAKGEAKGSPKTYEVRTPGPSIDAGSGGVPAVEKAIAIVRYLNGRADEAVSLSDIVSDLQLTKSHCHNILKTLGAAGWVSYDPQRRAYALAPKVLSDISGLVGRRDRPPAIHDDLVDLSTRTGIPAVLTRVDPDGSFVAIDKAEQSSEFLASVAIGHRFPPDSTAQYRVRLAWASAEIRAKEMKGWTPARRTPSSILSRRDFEAEVTATRERGYAISRSEYTPGVMTFAAPIFNAFREVQFILMCPGVEASVAPHEASIARALIETADKINRSFGGY